MAAVRPCSENFSPCRIRDLSFPSNPNFIRSIEDANGVPAKAAEDSGFYTDFDINLRDTPRVECYSRSPCAAIGRSRRVACPHRVVR